MSEPKAEKYPVTEKDIVFAEQLRKEGFEYSARYVETFGKVLWNPAFCRGVTPQVEQFYKKCVDEGHPYDWYFEFPEDALT